MKRSLLVFSLGVAMALPATVWADDEASVPQPASPSPQWSLEVPHPHVAAGALPSEEHCTEFIIRVRDANGQPLAGVPVELPHIWDDKGELGDKYPDEPYIRVPGVAWPSSGKTVLSDAKGEAHGRFTSGAMTGSVVLHGPGGTQAKIEQVWNDDPDPNREWETGGVGSMESACYILALQQGDEMIPITGHHLELKLRSITLTAWRRTGGTDENGQPEVESEPFDLKIKRPKAQASPDEWARWNLVSSWVPLGELKECEPGYYRGTYMVWDFGGDSAPRRDLEGVEISGISDYRTFTEDEGVYVGDNDNQDLDDLDDEDDD